MPAAEAYFIPAHDIEVTTEIKRSRFIAHIAHCPDPQQAMAIIEQDKQRYPDAGEPSGTAGKPILNVLQHSGYGEIICVVSRYFGGIKLGAGGLIRAYSNSTQAAIEQLAVKKVIRRTAVTIRFPYCYESDIRHFLDTHDVPLTDIDYQEQVIFTLEPEQSSMAETRQQLQNICKGELNIESLTG